jgi:steroid 5-alpha reductase family enzyme
MFQEFFPILEGAPMGGFWLLLIYGSLAVALWMFVLWLLHFKLQNAGVMDFGWASSLMFLGVFDALKADGYGPRRWLIGTMAFVWGGQLAWRLLSERILGENPEDPRYADLRERWRGWAGLRLLISFAWRALLAVLFSIPFALLSVDPLAEITVYEWIGLAVWAAALFGGWRTDVRLKRHALFEGLIWTAYFASALATPYGAWTIVFPLMMLLRWFKAPADDVE